MRGEIRKKKESVVKIEHENIKKSTRSIHFIKYKTPRDSVGTYRIIRTSSWKAKSTFTRCFALVSRWKICRRKKESVSDGLFEG